MKDKPKLLRKLDAVQRQLQRVRDRLNGKGEDYWDKERLRQELLPDAVMSEVLNLVRESTELLQNIGTAWRKGVR